MACLNELYLHPIPLMNLKNIILSERRQAQKVSGAGSQFHKVHEQPELIYAAGGHNAVTLVGE